MAPKTNDEADTKVILTIKVEIEAKDLGVFLTVWDDYMNKLSEYGEVKSAEFENLPKRLKLA